MQKSILELKQNEKQEAEEESHFSSLLVNNTRILEMGKLFRMNILIAH